MEEEIEENRGIEGTTWPTVLHWQEGVQLFETADASSAGDGVVINIGTLCIGRY
jgi:hypothetical protein